MKILQLCLISLLSTFIFAELTENWQKKNFMICISSTEIPLTEEEKTFDLNDFELYLKNLKEKYNELENMDYYFIQLVNEQFASSV